MFSWAVDNCFFFFFFIRKHEQCFFFFFFLWAQVCFIDSGGRQRPNVVHTHLRLRAPVTFLRVHAQHESRLESKARVNSEVSMCGLTITCTLGNL